MLCLNKRLAGDAAVQSRLFRLTLAKPFFTHYGRHKHLRFTHMCARLHFCSAICTTTRARVRADRKVELCPGRLRPSSDQRVSSSLESRPLPSEIPFAPPNEHLVLARQTSHHQTVQHLAASVFSCFARVSISAFWAVAVAVFAYVFLLTPHRQQTKDYKIMSLSAVCIPKWLCLVQRARSVHMWKHSQSFLRFAKSKFFFCLLSATIFLPRAERRNGFFVCLPEKLNGSGPRIKKGRKSMESDAAVYCLWKSFTSSTEIKMFPIQANFCWFCAAARSDCLLPFSWRKRTEGKVLRCRSLPPLRLVHLNDLDSMIHHTSHHNKLGSTNTKNKAGRIFLPSPSFAPH